MNGHIATIQSLTDAYGSEAEARWFRSLVKTYSSNRAEFWRQFGTNEVWGGSGSLLDQFMTSPAGRDMDNFLFDQRRFHPAMAALARELAAVGHNNPHAKVWATATEG